MPIYEFYCPECHTIFSFLARTAGSRKKPRCPKCDRPGLEKMASSFAISKGLPDSSVEDAHLERAMGDLMREAQGMREEDHAGMARLMRRFYETSGMQLGENMEEAIRRMESGEDPEKIEQEMGELLEREEPLSAGGGRGLGGLRRKIKPPAVDGTLYEL